jgi:hypothetical protein
MNDEDFVNLDWRDALAIVNGTEDAAERERLRSLYALRRQMLVNGSGSEFAPKLVATTGSASSDASMSRSDSGMLYYGRGIFLIGGGLLVLAVIIRFSVDPEGLPALLGSALVLYVSTALLSLGAFMWMLGALEQRLIEIRMLLSGSAEDEG